MWHVTLTVGGEPSDPEEVRSALERLGAEQPFLVEGRYAGDRVEIDYWEEAEGCEDAAALALRLWGEHRVTAGLPAWSVLGLEVVEHGVLASRRGRLRRRRQLAAVPVAGAVRLRPLPG
jgi:hypothetical protein